MSYFFNEVARVEHLEHVAYYEARQSGLGARYLSAFDAAMVKVCEAPQRHRVEFPPDIRRYRVPGFPYNILYRQAGADVEVLVVAAHRRRPSYWSGRL
ncbi:type II toxin-antitoxin system RelE/ParE family toxin [Nevskia sp.]|uniref:type II toxin-antitoxin system RelE/ParE family toxin n=1 Tax=Nevskia sp. TaxID=1929292 RepID=UPI0025F304D0|nr:type II toxin-antitoxin system RelE/ParE family toxin [Nevskia sp.]